MVNVSNCLSIVWCAPITTQLEYALHDVSTSIGLTRCAIGYCVYLGNFKSAVVLLAVFVDDILIAPASDTVIAHVSSRFMRSIGYGGGYGVPQHYDPTASRSYHY